MLESYSLQILNHINTAIENGRHRNPDVGIPQVRLSLPRVAFSVKTYRVTFSVYIVFHMLFSKDSIIIKLNS